MLRVSRLVCGLACLITLTTAASAQEPLSLQIRNGQVSIKAQNVPLRTVLNEWARVGGTNVVGAERITGAPVTLELTDVPERQALDILLRNVSGYLLAMRQAGVQGASIYNRIIIMPPSAAPRALPAQAAGVAPRLPQLGLPNPEDGVEPDVVLEGPAGAVRPGPPVRLPNTPGPNTPTPAPLPIPESAPPLPEQTPGAVVVTPSNPFGVPAGSSSRPGEVTPVRPQQPGQRQDQN